MNKNRIEQKKYFDKLETFFKIYNIEYNNAQDILLNILNKYHILIDTSKTPMLFILCDAPDQINPRFNEELKIYQDYKSFFNELTKIPEIHNKIYKS